jgi:Xaa-Pro aminopeptidase
MFQSFDVKSTPQFGRERADTLRAAFDALGIDGFLVPRADEYQGEYVPASAERLSWLTGFTGSAGMALVMRNQAIVFVDGRYVTQLAEQVDGSVFTGGGNRRISGCRTTPRRVSGSASIRGCIRARKCAGWRRR